jgi:hypothetical protein
VFGWAGVRVFSRPALEGLLNIMLGDLFSFIKALCSKQHRCKYKFV